MNIFESSNNCLKFLYFMIFWDMKKEALHIMKKVNFLCFSGKNLHFLHFLGLEPGPDLGFESEKWPFCQPKTWPESFTPHYRVSVCQDCELPTLGLDRNINLGTTVSFIVNFLITAVQRYSEAWNAAVLPEKVD